MADGITPMKERILRHYVTKACELVLPFKSVARALKIDRPIAKRHVRQLAKMGYLELTTGFDEDGMIRGGGYMLTGKGYEWGKENNLTFGGYFL